MATISMIKNSTSVPQPVFLSDAAVEKAYNRAMGGVQLRSLHYNLTALNRSSSDTRVSHSYRK